MLLLVLQMWTNAKLVYTVVVKDRFVIIFLGLIAVTARWAISMMHSAEPALVCKAQDQMKQLID